MKVNDAAVTFETRPHSMRSGHAGYRPEVSGLYRIKVEIYAYQVKTLVTITLIEASEEWGGSELGGAFELYPRKPRTVSVMTYMTRDDYFPSVSDLDWDWEGKNIYQVGGAKLRRGGGCG
ncbi:MAG: hypothetical protein M2R45_05121 [Verrucomicrobia subdivision 3 bacterium]|nr:hypothetical protein [Limisphaerales bacterium]MCS1417183.1 hypothetical protein [Limisphaerales bacterium]